MVHLRAPCAKSMRVTWWAKVVANGASRFRDLENSSRKRAHVNYRPWAGCIRVKKIDGTLCRDVSRGNK